MKKRIFIILIIFCVTASAAYVYLNEVFLPTRIRALIVKSLEEATKKKVALRSVKLNIFKGIVLKDLVIYEDNIAIINSKEVSCRLLLLPLFSKNVMISSIHFTAPDIFIDRNRAGSFNIIELFSAARPRKNGFNIIVNRIGIKSAHIYFHDDTLTPPFIKEVDGVTANIRLWLPSKIKFDIKSGPSAEISGEYSFTDKVLAAKIAAQGVSLAEFAGYYAQAGVVIPQGAVDYAADIRVNEASAEMKLTARTKDLVIFKDTMIAKLNSDLEMKTQYAFADKRLIYSGALDIRDLNLSGVKDVERIDDIKGRIEFDDTHFSSQAIFAKTLGFPIEAKINHVNFQNPLFDIYLTSDVDLAALKTVLKERFNLYIPADITGKGKLHLTMQYSTPQYILSQIKGYITMRDAAVSPEKGKMGIGTLNGDVHFTSNQLSWNEMDFKYQNVYYKTSGILTNFESPGIAMQLYSEDLSLDSVFAANGKQLKFSRLEGQYNNSEFSIIGDINLGEQDMIYADIKGVFDIEMDDLKEPLKKFKDKWEKAKPAGRITADFNLKGNIKDIKSCLIDAKVKSDSFSLYGLKPNTLVMDYSQKNGVAEIKTMHSSLYDGVIDAAARLDLTSKDLPYWINADISWIRIEKLKADTPLKDRDISGVIHAKLTFSGALNDISALTGAGKAAITDGKLWQINLFKGLGLLLFTSDFQNIIFKEGILNFVVKDKEFFTNDLVLKSGLIDMSGTVKAGFDGSVDASLKAEITKEALATSARKDITTAIGKYSLIDISGTLKEPKYKFKPDMGNIVEDLKNRIFKQ